MYLISAECGYQILVTKICNGGRISYNLTDFFSKISAFCLLAVKYWTTGHLLDKLQNYTFLNH